MPQIQVCHFLNCLTATFSGHSALPLQPEVKGPPAPESPVLTRLPDPDLLQISLTVPTSDHVVERCVWQYSPPGMFFCSVASPPLSRSEVEALPFNLLCHSCLDLLGCLLYCKALHPGNCRYFGPANSLLRGRDAALCITDIPDLYRLAVNSISQSENPKYFQVWSKNVLEDRMSPATSHREPFI